MTGKGDKRKHKISDFRPQRLNANKHTARGLGALDNSIAEGGWIGSITVANDNECFDGSARLETVYTRFGEDVEPIVIESDGTRPVILKRTDIPNADDPRAKKLSILANRVAELDLSWDADLLAQLNDEIDLSGLFTDDELNGLLQQITEDAIGSPISEEEDERNTSDLLEQAEAGTIEPRFKLGDIIQLGRHKICCGDSTVEANVRQLLGDRFSDVGMVWADPPFNTGIQQGRTASSWGVIENDKLSKDDFAFFSSRFFQILDRVAKADAHIYVCCHWKSYPIFFNCKPNPKALIVWVKNNFGLGSGYRPQHELIIFWGKLESSTESNVWQISKDAASEYKHPTQKPVSLIQRAFNNSSTPGDLIFDPFLGSAPSIIAAEQSDRTVYGFELSEVYCTVIAERFQRFTGIEPEIIGNLNE
jgi:DNA modification methylase